MPWKPLVPGSSGRGRCARGVRLLVGSSGQPLLRIGADLPASERMAAATAVLEADIERREREASKT